LQGEEKIWHLKKNGYISLYQVMHHMYHSVTTSHASQCHRGTCIAVSQGYMHYCGTVTHASRGQM